MSEITTYELTGLPQLTEAEAAFSQAVDRYIAGRPLPKTFGDSLSSMLGACFKDPCNISEAEVRLIRPSEFDTLLPEVGCFVLVGTAPTESRIIIDLDARLALTMTERLLGGQGPVDQRSRPLSELEQGILSYPILKTLALVQEDWKADSTLSLTLDGFAHQREDLTAQTRGQSSFAALSFKLAIGRQLGHVRVLVPSALVDMAPTPLEQSDSHTPRELDYARRILFSLGHRPVTGRVEIATVQLSTDDRQNLEIGDVILLEDHSLTLTPEGPAGRAKLTVGDGNNGTVAGEVLCDHGQLKLQISNILIREQPAEAMPMTEIESQENQQDPSAEDAEAPAGTDVEDNLENTQGLLRDIETPIAVELGRINLNAAQVVKLRAGQILRLPRAATDPVDLVVGDKVFARGELVEIEGELGIRLVQLAAASMDDEAKAQ